MSLTPCYKEGSNTYEIGVDEAGRGPLFGRVYAAAVLLPKHGFDFSKMKDSKKFHSKKKINEAAEYIKENALAWGVAFADEKTIDRVNILQATQMAMHESISQILGKGGFEDSLLLIDGNFFNNYASLQHVCVEGGDNKYASIAAASILAKVARDAYIEEMCDVYPDLDDRYGLRKNKGYGTHQHLEGIRQYGGSQWHRKSFGLLKTASITEISLM